MNADVIIAVEKAALEPQSLIYLCLKNIHDNIKRYDTLEGCLDNDLLVRLIQMLKESNKLSGQVFKTLLVKEIETLDLSDEAFVSESTLRLIGQRCPSLYYLNLSGLSSTVSDTILDYIVRRCKKLRAINVSKCKNLTNSAIKSIAKFCPDLLSLDLSTVSQITDEALLLLASSCSRLKNLNIPEMPHITASAIHEIKKLHPDINIYSDFNTPIMYSQQNVEPFGFLSIHSPHPIQLLNVKWPTVQHFFQAQKFAGTPYEQVILNAPSAFLAKRWGASRKHPIREDWEDVKVDLLFQGNLAKFQQHPHLKSLLLATGDRPIIRHTKDTFWADGLDGSGKNMQGNILMRTREVLAQNNKSTVSQNSIM